MSRLGQFAVRYEKLQRGLQSQAELELSRAVAEEQQIETQLQAIRVQFESAQRKLREGRTGQDWLYEFNQLQALEAKAQTLYTQQVNAMTRVSECESEVRRIYTEAERWEDVGEKELKRDLDRAQKTESIEADERAVQLFGRVRA